MPHINRIRVNNVKYNFGTQYYDDFVMRFSGKNTIYDLANGGGKSVLMLLLLQNLLPNCTLDEKQPIEKLFRTETGSTTIHSLIEWRLSDVHIKNGFKYMTTGFCARKAKDTADNAEENTTDNSDTANIEYFNYCIFYREFNDNDIKNLPLTNGKDRITYTGLKNYLRNLQKSDYNLEIQIFDTKREYQKFISDYGLYESEWEIIRGINKTEGHVRTYFETNYKTTRKVVEDLFIEEVIRKSFVSKMGTNNSGEDKAQTLLDIKDELINLAKKKNTINNYDRQIDLIESFRQRLLSLEQFYSGKQELTSKLSAAYNEAKTRLTAKTQLMDNLFNEKQDIYTSIENTKKLEETAQVALKKQEYAEVLTKLVALEKNYKEVEDNLFNAKRQLTYNEAANDYLDYLYYKKERDAVKQSTEHAYDDNEELMSSIHEIVNELKNRMTDTAKQLNDTLNNEIQLIKKEENSCEALNKQERELDKEISVYNFMLEELKHKEESFTNEITELKGKVGIMMAVNAKEELNKTKGELNQMVETISKKTKEGEEASGSMAIKAQELKFIEGSIVDIEKKLAQISGKTNEYITYKRRINSIKEVYAENDEDKLEEAVLTKRDDMREEEKALNTIIKQQTQYIEGLNSNRPITNSLEIDKVMDYIERYHGDIASVGSTYLSGLEPSRRKELLDIYNALPYCIIVKRDFNKLISDKLLGELDLGNYSVTLINEEQLKDKLHKFDDMGVLYITKNKELHYDETKVKAEIVKAKVKLSEARDRIERLTISLDTVTADYEFVKLYENVYKPSLNDAQKEYEMTKQQLKNQQEDYNSKKEFLLELTNSREEGIKKLEELSLKKEQLLANVDILEKIVEMYVKLQDIMSEAKNRQIHLTKIVKEHADITARLQAANNQYKNRINKEAALRMQIKQVNDIWDKEYSHYYVEGEYKRLKEATPELEAKYSGIKDLLISKTGDMQDKQKLISNYETAMEKSLLAIDYKGIMVEELNKLQESNSLFRTENSELVLQKQNINKLDVEVNIARKKSKDIQSVADRLDGGINNAIMVITQKYGNYEELVEQDEAAVINIEEAILSYKQRIEEYNKIIVEKETERKLCEDSIIKLSLVVKDIDRAVLSTGIIIDEEATLLESEENIEEKCTQILSAYDKFVKASYSKKEEFDSERNMLVDTLNKLEAVELANEFTKNVKMPASLEETQRLVTSLEDINSCIALEKEQIQKGIEDMERIKVNFETQCIQTCINIKNELDKLSKLSKITMDQEQISIINLSVPYIREDSIKTKMTEYIDEIVRVADTYSNSNDRLKYIKNKLSWKNMFSVIVTDMNSIKLNLYKRERIKEQSRYLKYEEAVGSTGQSQGIYIQFLIAVVNYISSINSPNTDAYGLKKVIFIDNPFGAAKDIYIWEPIFKLLKTNNVQLVVPARGTTPAITGRFDVNYILGQKMVNGRQQTVVVDYFSNTQTDEIEYEKMTYSQNALF